MAEKGYEKAGPFLKVRLNIGEKPGSNPPSMEKPAQAIYENETCFLREKSPQTLGITEKMIADLF